MRRHRERPKSECRTKPECLVQTGPQCSRWLAGGEETIWWSLPGGLSSGSVQPGATMRKPLHLFSDFELGLTPVTQPGGCVFIAWCPAGVEPAVQWLQTRAGIGGQLDSPPKTGSGQLLC
jgi:hypothetical protein